MTGPCYRITALVILNIGAFQRSLEIMKTILFTCLCVLSLSAAAQAACYADYKAKKDSPLQLHYGVMQLPDGACGSAAAASRVVAPRLAQAGWTLLNVVSVFDESQLAGKKANAGQFFLRF